MRPLAFSTPMCRGGITTTRPSRPSRLPAPEGIATIRPSLPWAATQPTGITVVRQSRPRTRVVSRARPVGPFSAGFLPRSRGRLDGESVLIGGKGTETWSPSRLTGAGLRSDSLVAFPQDSPESHQTRPLTRADAQLTGKLLPEHPIRPQLSAASTVARDQEAPRTAFGACQPVGRPFRCAARARSGPRVFR